MSVELGHVFKVMPIPAVEEATSYFEAGTLRIGVEDRRVDPDFVSAHFVDAPAELRAEAEEFRPPQPDGGLCLHVISASDGLERLRFDCFELEPHYHYIDWNNQSHLLVPFDPAANGDPLKWALSALHARLPEMLVRAGAGDFAASLQAEDIEHVLASVDDACAQLQ
jgi:hypothetical protein